MSHKLTLNEVLGTIISQPVEMVRIVIIITLGEFGRWLYGGGRFRERCGDLILCLMLFYLIRSHVKSIATALGVDISPGAIAIIISLLGAHGIGQMLFYAIKKRTGIDLSELLGKSNKS